MFKKIEVFLKLKQIHEPLFVLSNGLYTLNHVFLEFPIGWKQEWPFKIGDTIKVKSRLSWVHVNSCFEKVILYTSGEFESIPVRELSIDLILKEIMGRGYDIKKNPFELFLEVFLIKLVMESLTNSKSLLGGIWTTGGLLSGPTPYGRTTFSYFAQNVDEKNKIIMRLKNKLNEYPDIFVTDLSEYQPAEFNSEHSPYSTFLEYRILQIRYKIILQEICLHSHYLTIDEKKRFDNALHFIKELLESYPVKNLVST